MKKRAELTTKQREYVAARAGGATIAQAARGVDVSERAARFWETTDAIKTAIRREQDARLAIVAARATEASTKAIDTLVSIMTDESAAFAVRHNAARSLLDITVKYHEVVTFAARLAALEEVHNVKPDKIEGGREAVY